MLIIHKTYSYYLDGSVKKMKMNDTPDVEMWVVFNRLIIVNLIILSSHTYWHL